MSVNLRAVFSHAPHEVDEDAFNEHYDFHLSRILTYDGFVGARRYRLAPLLGETSPAVYEYLSLYEIDGDPSEVLKPLRADVKDGRIAHPEWFRALPRSSWSCYAMDPSPSGLLVDRPYLVLSHAPPAVDESTYAAGYEQELLNHLRRPDVRAGGRFMLVKGTTDDNAPSEATFLALYSASGPLDGPALLPENGESSNDGRFVILEATPVGPVQRPAPVA